MAEAVGKATGRPGVCFVTRGPGATNAAHGVHIARQSSSPMILFVGQVDRALAWPRRLAGARLRRGVRLDGQVGGRDRRRGPRDRDGLARLPRRDERTARPGRAGAAARHADRGDRRGRRAAGRAGRALARRAPTWRALRGAARRGGRRRSCCWAAAAGTRPARAAVTRFAERFELPVATGFRRLPLFDPLHPNYAGDLGLGPNPTLLARVKAADLVLAIGARLKRRHHAGLHARSSSPSPAPGSSTSSPSPPSSAGSGARTWRSTPRPTRFAAALDALSPPASPRWRGAARGGARRRTSPGRRRPTPQPGDVNLAEIMIWLRDNLPADAILTNGAGNFAAWVNRFYRVRRFGGPPGDRTPARWATACPPRSPCSGSTRSGGWWRSAATATS